MEDMGMFGRVLLLLGVKSALYKVIFITTHSETVYQIV